MQLADQKRETFAQHRAHGKSMSESARAADYKACGNMGSRLAKEPQVAARIEELSKAYKQAADSGPGAQFKSEPWIVVELASLHKTAKKKGNYAASVSALIALARIGKLIDTPGANRATIRNTTNVTFNVNELHANLKSQLAEVSPAERQRLLDSNPDLAELLGSGDVIDVSTEDASGA